MPSEEVLEEEKSISSASISKGKLLQDVEKKSRNTAIEI